MVFSSGNPSTFLVGLVGGYCNRGSGCTSRAPMPCAGSEGSAGSARVHGSGVRVQILNNGFMDDGIAAANAAVAEQSVELQQIRVSPHHSDIKLRMIDI